MNDLARARALPDAVDAVPGRPAPGELADQLRQAIVRAARQLRRQGDSGSLAAGALSALGALNAHGAMTVGELARHEQVTPPMITRIARQLDERGLIGRYADPDDGRITRLEVTPEGKDFVEQRVQAGTSYLMARLGAFTDAERAVLELAAPLLRRLAEPVGSGRVGAAPSAPTRSGS